MTLKSKSATTNRNSSSPGPQRKLRRTPTVAALDLLKDDISELRGRLSVLEQHLDELGQSLKQLLQSDFVKNRDDYQRTLRALEAGNPDVGLYPD